MAVRSDGETMAPNVYRGEYTVKSFLYYIQLMERTIRNDLHKRKDLNMTRENWADYNKASECHICHETLYKNNFLDSVGAYDSDTGEYIRLVDMKTNKCYSSTFKIGTFLNRIYAIFVVSLWLEILSEILSGITAT